MRQQVEVTVPRPQREQIPCPKCPNVEWSAYTFRKPAADSGERFERRCQVLQVVAIKIHTQVNVPGERRGAVDLGSQSADQHEIDVRIEQRLEDEARFKSWVLAHSATRLIERRSSTKCRSSVIARTSRSDDVNFSKSRICVRSIPMPSRGITS